MDFFIDRFLDSELFGFLHKFFFILFFTKTFLPFVSFKHIFDIYLEINAFFLKIHELFAWKMYGNKSE